jgi:outer membrane protein FlgP
MTQPIPQKPALMAPALFAVAASLVLGACSSGTRSAVASLPDDASAHTQQLAHAKDMLDAMEPSVSSALPFARPAALTGNGFAQVAAQPGQTLNQRRLLAMRAARLDALRDLTEQVHGITLTSDSVMRDAILRDDRLAAHVQGTLRGARTIAIEPRGEDGYAVTMQLDTDTVAYLLRAVGK